MLTNRRKKGLMMTDHTPEELAEYYKGALERIVRIASGLTLAAFETNEGRNYTAILAGPPPKPKWTAGRVMLGGEAVLLGAYAEIDYGLNGPGAQHRGRIIVCGDGKADLRDAIIDFLNKREEG